MTSDAPALSVCVFCGSRPGADPAYAEAAETFGTALAQEGWRLVYGAGDVGLMGGVARAAQAAGGETFGVIPVHLLHAEVGKRDLTNFVVTENMHERKKVMFMNSDAVVVLPGGAGTLDEFFEILTWAQLGLHAKPIILLNTSGFWTPLVALVDHVIERGFAAETLRALVTLAENPAAAMQALRAHEGQASSARS
ncbi:decarboxylase family protein [Pseudooceanicola batsensis HTCC2597]|uniref:Cytokinin riboside 5'-monophosphate phosphoribohydrolase n=1 Tax=Pseudooceanicola batsensis (strain ATCC BAA-863 / DSM 15984 / KCTC 12145 / HTCC2597) TaxID=252305 RepID=A3TSB7_PSEBH|nr:TIGR00730 family Rossman fold protein [Pseudooceanicola batsensis]EAQ04544.1 decarboxylase family protein [Pseudooceanicola batsensis HTCC2597]